MDFTGKTAIVTGATGGIGGEVARLIATRGGAVIATGRDEQRGAALVERIAREGGSATFIPADLDDVAGLRAFAAAAGDVDILINNAAIFPGAPTTEQSVEDIDASFRSNVRAPYLLTAALVPAMLSKGSGSIVNVSTMAAKVGMPGLSVYSATKAALESLTRTWAAEFSPSGVRVNAVAPGPTGTDAVMTVMGPVMANQIAATTLLGRMASPREIAEVIAFLASDDASFVTGAVWAADAGRTAI